MIKDKIPGGVKTAYRNVRQQFLEPRNNPIMSRIYGDSLTVIHKDVKMIFDTSSPLAKRWFYPRYRDGTLHEPAVSKALFDQLNPDSVFIDVGANVGFYSVLAAQIASEVHSFEMDPRLAGIVRSHFEKDPSIGSSVKVVPAAVNNTSGDFVSFTPHIIKNLSTNTIVSEEENRSLSSYRVPTVALDDYVNKHDFTPDVLKIDVEGAETAALEGLKNTLKTDVQTVFLEVHPNLLKRQGSSIEEAINFLKKAGFSCTRFRDRRTSSDTAVFESFNDISTIDENTMILATAEDT